MELSQQWLNQNIWLIVLLAVWEFGWKGWALWVAARDGNKAWFVALLLINTAGLLPILYLFVLRKQTRQQES